MQSVFPASPPGHCSNCQKVEPLIHISPPTPFLYLSAGCPSFLTLFVSVFGRSRLSGAVLTDSRLSAAGCGICGGECWWIESAGAVQCVEQRSFKELRWARWHYSTLQQLLEADFDFIPVVIHCPVTQHVHCGPKKLFLHRPQLYRDTCSTAHASSLNPGQWLPPQNPPRTLFYRCSDAKCFSDRQTASENPSNHSSHIGIGGTVCVNVTNCKSDMHANFTKQ